MNFRTLVKCSRSIQFITTLLLLLLGLLKGAAHAEFTVLHAFTEASDGRAPNGVSAQFGPFLYGVAEHGGANGDGTLWTYNASLDIFNVLHDFSAASDGATPVDLTTDGSAIYGTTSAGGANTDGTIWQRFPGPFDNRRDMLGATDGASPRGILYKNGHVYRVSLVGGANDGGTIWSMNTTTGSFDVLHNLSVVTDGTNLVGRPVFSGDILYGAAAGGGANGAGTVWSLDTTANDFTNLHDFVLASDGDSPVGDLALVGNLLYGTALEGGANGAGTLWSFDTTTGAFANLHDFEPSLDGDAPSGVVQFGDRLIGIAANGGLFDDGTIWSYETSSGQFATLHAFDRDIDGSFPAGHLLIDGNVLYGGTTFGGSQNGGTIWSIKVPEPASLVLASLLCAMLAIAHRFRGTPHYDAAPSSNGTSRALDDIN